MRAWESAASGPDGDLHDAVALVGEQVVGLLDLRQTVGVRDQLAEGEPLGGDDAHEAPHTLLAARAQARDDVVIAQARRERVERHRQVAGVDAQARDRAARAYDAQAVL